MKVTIYRYRWLIALVILVGVISPAVFSKQSVGQAAVNLPVAANNLYLPVVIKNFPWDSLFGVEVGRTIQPGSTLADRAMELQVGWLRMNSRISWREMQPVEGGAINWTVVAAFENELRALKLAGIKPIVIVSDYPEWATYTRTDGLPSYCGPLLAEKFSAYASFMRSLANRYKQPEFNVHNWEIGNEPDVDPELFGTNESVFGCWGDMEDPFYGGRHYGEMLKVVAPIIKAEDPSAQVWIGGLLLDRPDSVSVPPSCFPYTNCGRSELFLQGILEAGAAPYFDVVPFHAYIAYRGETIDYDNGDPFALWYSLGGIVAGKANFLRQMMSTYGVDKPLFINEIGLMCAEYYPDVCTPPTDDFYQAQADFLVRTLVRGWSNGITGYTWYTLDGPGWRYGGLLYDSSTPRPSFIAYQQLSEQLYGGRYLGTVGYGTGIEAYRFSVPAGETHVVWARFDETLTILVPQVKFIEARDRSGALITPPIVGENYQISVGFEPVYVTVHP